MFLRGGQCVTVHGLYTRKKLNLIHLKHIRVVSKLNFSQNKITKKFEGKRIKRGSTLAQKETNFYTTSFFFRNQNSEKRGSVWTG